MGAGDRGRDGSSSHGWGYTTLSVVDLTADPTVMPFLPILLNVC
jgi:hypothetical protein